MKLTAASNPITIQHLLTHTAGLANSYRGVTRPLYDELRGFTEQTITYLDELRMEFRRHHRKTTELEGTYDVHPPATGGGKVKIINLSLSGACIEVRGVHDLKIGQQGSLVFSLDNRKKTALFKRVVIKSINGNRIGCEFVQDQAYEKDLGFYLLP